MFYVQTKNQDIKNDEEIHQDHFERNGPYLTHIAVRKIRREKSYVIESHNGETQKEGNSNARKDKNIFCK